MFSISKRALIYKHHESMVIERCRFRNEQPITKYRNHVRGVQCTWSTILRSLNEPTKRVFTWKFDWSNLKCKNIEKWVGSITLTSPAFPDEVIDVEITKKNSKVSKIVELLNIYPISVNFECVLVPFVLVRGEEEVDEKMFNPSKKTNAILLVEGRRIHVNKEFLAYHSEFFRTLLFSSSFLEGSLEEIPIKDVTYKDFTRLLATIYPHVVFPNDHSSRKILELADRFLMAGVIFQVEQHIKHTCNYSEAEIYELAENYMLPGLLDEDFEKDLSGEERKERFEKMFEQSDVTDAVLLVEGRQLHVNKAFLSFHSAYFFTLFSTKREIYDFPKVCYDCFVSLLGMIYPDPVYPNDTNAVELLDLAKRFSMEAAIRHVENYLLTFSKIKPDELVQLAEKFKSSRMLNSINDLQVLQMS